MTLITDYRPDAWEDVVGHEDVIKSLNSIVRGRNPRSGAFLLHGPPGIGKTTIARILGRELNAEISEIDAATEGSADRMRYLAALEPSPFTTGGTNRVIIVDECHALSSAAWKPLLKSVEESRAGTFWIFCTTNLSKVDRALKSRCVVYGLKPISAETLRPWLRKIIGTENAKAPNTDRLIGLITKRCEGLPRTALAMLAAVLHCDNINEASVILDGFGSVAESEQDAVILLCRLLAKRPGKERWPEAAGLLQQIDHTQAMGARITMERYFSTMACNVGKPGLVEWSMSILESWASIPYGMDQKAALVLVAGRAIL